MKTSNPFIARQCDRSGEMTELDACIASGQVSPEQVELHRTAGDFGVTSNLRSRSKHKNLIHLQKIIASTYQIAGAYNAPEHVLDVLSNPLGATDAQVNALLPFAVPKPVQPAKRVVTLIERLRHTASKGVSVWGDLQIEAAKELEILASEVEIYASAMDRMTSAAAQPATTVQISETLWGEILGAIARGWCHEKNASKTMDSDLAVAVGEEIKALIAQPVSNIEFLYEELRKATDGGSESMTHDDALAQIKYWSDMAAIAQPAGQLCEDAFGRGQVMWFNKPVDGAMLHASPPIAQPVQPAPVAPTPAMPNWSNRNTASFGGWINELLTLSDHSNKAIPTWARGAMKTIANGLQFTTPVAQPVQPIKTFVQERAQLDQEWCALQHLQAAYKLPPAAVGAVEQEIRRVGALMSNVCFNLSHQEGRQISELACEGMKALSDRWDAAIASKKGW